MKSIGGKDIAELVGVVAIVASLIFVGLQIKQSYEIAIAGQYQARFDSFVAINSSKIESDVALRVTGKRVLADAKRVESLPENLLHWLENTPVEEVGYHYLSTIITLKQLDNVHYQYRSGFLDKESWQPLRASLVNELLDVEVRETPNFMRIVYEFRGFVLHPAFQAEVESILQEANTDAQK